MRGLRLIVLLALILPFLPGNLSAQYDPVLDTAVMPFQAYDGGQLDSVNLGTGTLTLHIPLVSYPQRGGKLHVDYHIRYNNLSYYLFVCPVVSQGCLWRSVPSGSNNLGGIVSVTAAMFPQLNFVVVNCGAACSYSEGIITEADGSSHPMGFIDNNQTTSHLRSLDGSGLLATTSGSGRTVVDRSGVTYTCPLNSSQSNPCTATDPNGNQIVFNLCCGFQGFTDTMGRQFQGTTLPAPNGQTVTYPVSNGSVTLPDGKSYTFEYKTYTLPLLYQQTTAQTYPVLSKITLPSGGSISYGYGATPVADNCAPPGPSNYYAPVISRSVDANDGTGPHTWTYSRDTSTKTVTVIDPFGIKSYHRFTNLCYPYEIQYQQFDSAGQLLKTVNTQYVPAVPAAPYNTYVAPLGVFPASVTAVWPNGQQSQVSTTYDKDHGSSFRFGNLTTWGGIQWGTAPSGYTDNPWGTTETDNGQGAPGIVLRKTNTSYQAFVNLNYFNENLLDLSSSIQVQDGGGVQRAYTTYGYDGVSVVSSGVVQQHIASETYPGNLTSTNTWLSGGSAISQPPCNVAVASGGYLVSSNVYYDTGEIQKAIDPCKYTTTSQYSATYVGTYPTTVTNALNQSATYAYDFNTGNVTSITDPNSKSSSKTYDIMGRLTQVTYPDGGQTAYCYTDIGGSTCSQASAPPYAVVATKIISSSPTVINKISTGVFNGLGRLIQTQLNSDPDGVTYTDITYDAFGRMSTVTNPHRSVPSTTDGTTKYVYDGLSRVCVIGRPDGTAVSQATGCPVTAPAGNTFTQYAGSCTSVTDEAGVLRKSCVDGLGRMTQVWEDPGVAPHLNYETDYTYNALDDLLSVTQKGSNAAAARVRTFNYDSLSRLTSAIHPESGQISYAYDADGNLTTKTGLSPNQSQSGTATVATNFTYDALNRPTHKGYADSYPGNGVTAGVTYGYDGVAPGGCTPPTITGATNLIGRRSSMCDASGTASWSYDAVGRPFTETRSLNSVTNTFNYRYYLDGELAHVYYPSSDHADYQVTSAGRSWGVSGPGGAYIPFNTKYTPQGTVSSMWMGANYTAGQIYSNFYYNNRLQPQVGYAKRFVNGVADALLNGYCYDFHLGLSGTFGDANVTCSVASSAQGNNGNVYKITNQVNNSRTQTFAYDTLNRITQGYTTGGSWGETFTIDAWGNLTNRGPVAGKTNYEPLDAAPATVKNQLAGFGYDAAGNMISNGTASYTYDAENRLTATAGWTYVYDGNGERVIKCNGTYPTCTAGTIYWGGPSGLAESSLVGTMNAEYLFYLGKRIARNDLPGNIAHYYLQDNLGSVRATTDATGTLERQTDYSPYGGEIWTNGTNTNHYKFTGKERDAESTLDYFGARYYSSSLARFTSPDPAFVGEVMELPQTWNRYSYVYNRPTFATDSDGRCPPCIGALVGAVVEGGWNLGEQVVKHGWGNVSWQEVGANAAGGAISGAIVGATGGLGLVGDALVGAGSSAVGGVVTRGLSGEDPDEAFAPSKIGTDALSGLVGGGIAHYAAELVHVPEEPGVRPKGRRKGLRYDAAVKARNKALDVHAGVHVAVHGAIANGFKLALDELKAMLNGGTKVEDEPQPHVTHRIIIGPIIKEDDNRLKPENGLCNGDGGLGAC